MNILIRGNTWHFIFRISETFKHQKQANINKKARMWDHIWIRHKLHQSGTWLFI